MNLKFIDTFTLNLKQKRIVISQLIRGKDLTLVRN